MPMNCPECERLEDEFERCEEMYLDALDRAGSDRQRANPHHYFRLRKAVQDAKLGLDLVSDELNHHQAEHAVVN